MDFNRRIQVLESGPGISNGELPVHTLLPLVPVHIPSSRFPLKFLDGGDSSVQASLGKSRKLDFGYIQPRKNETNLTVTIKPELPQDKSIEDQFAYVQELSAARGV